MAYARTWLPTAPADEKPSEETINPTIQAEAKAANAAPHNRVRLLHNHVTLRHGATKPGGLAYHASAMHASEPSTQQSWWSARLMEPTTLVLA